MYDIAVVGAGPAGSAFARLAPQNLKIALIEKRNLDDQENFLRIKCCGGLLAPAAQRELAKQGLGLPDYVLRGPQTFSVKSIDLDNHLVRFYQRHYINMDREQFDRWLVSLVPSSVDLFFSHMFVSYDRKDGYFNIILRTDEGEREIKAKFIVAADGAGSMIRRREFPGNTIPVYVSIQDTYEHGRIFPYYYSIFNRDTSDFYSWIIQKGKHIQFGSAVPSHEDAAVAHETLTLKLKELGIIEGSPIARNGSLIFRPEKNSQIVDSKEGIYFIGESAGFISPSSAEGISYALKSGRKLAESFKDSNKVNKVYSKSVRSLRFNLTYKRFKSTIMYNRLLRKIIMLSGIISIKVKEDND